MVAAGEVVKGAVLCKLRSSASKCKSSLMPMPAKYITMLITACLVLSSYCLFAQTKRAKIAVDRQMKDTKQ